MARNTESKARPVERGDHNGLVTGNSLLAMKSLPERNG